MSLWNTMSFPASEAWNDWHLNSFINISLRQSSNFVLYAEGIKPVPYNVGEISVGKERQLVQ